jgi:hypothetical protein
MLAGKANPARAFDPLPANAGHVVIAGFGRVGQIVARVLAAKKIDFTALDSDPEHVDGVRKFGARIFYGDASRPEILDAARPIERAPSCWRSTGSKPPCARRRWSSSAIRTCRSLPARATVATRTSSWISASRSFAVRPFSPRSISRARCCGAWASPNAMCALPSTHFGLPTGGEDYTHYTDTEKLQARARTRKNSRTSSLRTPPSRRRPPPRPARFLTGRR